ncbi:hypothetical protein QFC24_006468 [Naganishia onofrii]|uniref:Uncharacterized protein n=1 Tax=Naganishia onofrii TaxID=1851511 RepID=A0ACC2X209_9TREE|nr:hypothetical protein QFC24_006468 [Naganishia onofrii]
MQAEASLMQLPTSSAFEWPQATNQTVSTAPVMNVEPAPSMNLEAFNANVEPASVQLPTLFDIGLPFGANEAVPQAHNADVDPAAMQFLLTQFEATYQALPPEPMQQAVDEMRTHAIPPARKVCSLPKKIRTQPSRPNPAMPAMEIDPALIDPALRDPVSAQTVFPTGLPAEPTARQTVNPFKVPKLPERFRALENVNMVTQNSQPMLDPMLSTNAPSQQVVSGGLQRSRFPERLWNLSGPNSGKLVPPTVIDPTRPAIAPWVGNRQASSTSSARAPSATAVSAARQQQPASTAARPASAARTASDVLWIPRQRTILPFPPRPVEPPAPVQPPAKALEQVVNAGSVDMTYSEAAALADANETGSPSIRRLAALRKAELLRTMRTAMEPAQTEPMFQQRSPRPHSLRQSETFEESHSPTEN